MKPFSMFVTLLFTAIFLFSPADFSFAQSSIDLPAPVTDGGKPLMRVLRERKSERSFSSRELPSQVLSDLLWAACGINRPDTQGRTAPSAKNRQEIDVYVAMSQGLFLYDPLHHRLVLVIAEDIRGLTGTQDFVAEAPVNLIFVADHLKMEGMTGPQKEFYAATDTGFISENIYLYCASEGLSTVVRGLINTLSLGKAMKLRPSQRIILAQTVGFPK